MHGWKWKSLKWKSMGAAVVVCSLLCVFAFAEPEPPPQTGGNAASIGGTVEDPSGSVVVGARVEIRNPVSSYERTATTDSQGRFTFTNVPFNPYHLTVTAEGFSGYAQDVDARSTVPTNLVINLAVNASTTTVDVEAEGGDLIENDSTFHTDIDKSLLQTMPLENQTSGLSAAVTQGTPGVSADSNGQLHGLGDHAENSISMDGQPMTDQISKVFSNQLPLDAVQSMEVISGAPPAEYGGKTSVVINVTTQSGQGQTTPHGAVIASYGSFGTSTLGFNVAYGGKNWGNFISANGLQSGRFLDPPEFAVMHDKGNEGSMFDRVDWQTSEKDSLHFDFSYTRSWFQTPNTYDQQSAAPWSGLSGVLPGVENYGGIGPDGQAVGSTDQRSKIETFNIAPSWTRVINNNTVFTLGGWVRRDDYHYYPSGNPFADLGPPSLQRQSVGQQRDLTNAGMRATLSYVKGIHNIKGGVTYGHTFLNENDTLGIVDPAYNAPCITLDAASGTYVAVPGLADPSECAGANQANVAANLNAPGSTLYPLFNPVLAPYDLTRGGTLFAFNGHADVKELGVYLEDTITKGQWSLNLGLRGDVYNGLTSAGEAQPRIGISYNVKKTSTVLRVSYARTLESPFNENLVLSSLGCADAVLNPLLSCSPGSAAEPLSPGFRNEFHAGIEQAFGKYLVFSGEYIWKYTHNGYDFSVLGNTPITFPIEWHNSKIPGYAGRVSVPNYHGFTALFVFSSVAARFFTPQIGGAGATVTTGQGLPFRIDHDEKFNQTMHLQYQILKRGPWVGFNWRYDSGMVAGQAPCYGVNPGNDCPQSATVGGQPAILMEDGSGNPLSADLEYEAGFACGGVRATPTSPLPFVCPATEFSSNLINVAAPNTQNDDRHPARIVQRSLFDLSIGHDNLFHGDRFKWSAQLTAVNLTNDRALYNFLSTFSGTHYVTPRGVTAEIGFHF